MSVVWCRCPNSGRRIETSIESDPETLVKMRQLRLSFSVWCPHCRTNHQVQATDAIIAESSIDWSVAAPSPLEPVA